MRQKDFDPRRVKCILCPMTFASASVLQAHCSNVHSEGVRVLEDKLVEGYKKDSAMDIDVATDTNIDTIAKGNGSKVNVTEEMQLLKESRIASLKFWEAVAKYTPYAQISMHEKTKVEGYVLGADAIQTQILVKDLKTPMGTYPSAMLRGCDVLSIEFIFPPNAILPPQWPLEHSPETGYSRV